MNVEICDNEMPMSLLNGLPEEYDALIGVLDAINDDESKLNFEFVKSRVIKEAQRINMRTKSAQDKAKTAALLSKRLDEFGLSSRLRPYCNYFERPGHIESKCRIKFPHLNPQSKKDLVNKPALVLNQSEEDPMICLMTKHNLIKDMEPFFFLMSKYENAKELKLSAK